MSEEKTPKYIEPGDPATKISDEPNYIDAEKVSKYRDQLYRLVKSMEKRPTGNERYHLGKLHAYKSVIEDLSNIVVNYRHLSKNFK